MTQSVGLKNEDKETLIKENPWLELAIRVENNNFR
jgi:hypothetical protein